MRIKNVSNRYVTFSDLFVPKTQVHVQLHPNQETDIFDDDAKKSVGLKLLIDSGKIIKIGSQEPIDGPEEEIEESQQEQLSSTLELEPGSFAPPVQTITHLKALTGMQDKQVRLVEDLESLYRFDVQSTDIPDNDLIIQPIVGLGRWFKLNSTSGGSGHLVEDEGSPLPQRNTINFVGSGVTVTDTGSKTEVTISGAGVAYAKQSVIVTNPISDHTVVLTSTPITNSEVISWNGLVLSYGVLKDYTLSGNTVTLNSGIVLTIGDELQIIYSY